MTKPTPTVLRIALPLLALLWAPPSEGRPNLSASQLKQLGRARVLSFTKSVGGPVRAGKAIGVFWDTPEAVLHALLAVDKFKHFVPKMRDSRIVKRKGRVIYAVIATTLPWPVKDAWAYVKVAYRRTGARRFEVRWKMRNGNLKQYQGRALVEPWNSAATQTVLTYQLLFEPKGPAPASRISKGVKHVAEMFVHRLRLRVQALRRFRKFPKNLRQRYR